MLIKLAFLFFLSFSAAFGCLDLGIDLKLDGGPFFGDHNINVSGGNYISVSLPGYFVKYSKKQGWCRQSKGQFKKKICGNGIKANIFAKDGSTVIGELSTMESGKLIITRNSPSAKIEFAPNAKLSSKDEEVTSISVFSLNNKRGTLDYTVKPNGPVHKSFSFDKSKGETKSLDFKDSTKGKLAGGCGSKLELEEKELKHFNLNSGSGAKAIEF
jgi:hypothetical protein